MPWGNIVKTVIVDILNALDATFVGEYPLHKCLFDTRLLFAGEDSFFLVYYIAFM